MKDRILQTLHDLRAYARTKPCDIELYYHEEDSALMRFANSAISLNTSEHLIRLEITAVSGRQRASHEIITDLEKVAEMKQGIDIAAEMVAHTQPLQYQPTVPIFTETFSDESSFDPALVGLTNADKLAYFNQAAAGLETEQLLLSGIFSSGVNTIAQINTRSEHSQFFRTLDAQVSAVLAHVTQKWEVQAEQSAQRRADLDPFILHTELDCLAQHNTHDRALQLPLGAYDIVFGSAAIADLLSVMSWVGFNGGAMKRGYSFLREDQVSKKVFSKQFTLTDDATRRETFPFQRDFTGILRGVFPLFKEGVFQGFIWRQDDADEFAQQPTGHTVDHMSLALQGGERTIETLEELIALPRTRDLLYIPFLHYMNLVNPSKGLVTASSRFGALLLKADGSVEIPYNVRLTQSLLDIFGDKVAWLTRKTIAYNTSVSYGARNPTAVVVPQFMCVNDLEISHSNPSF